MVRTQTAARTIHSTTGSKNVQPQRQEAVKEQQAAPEMQEFDDAKFVGMKGGEIFEEVLRQLGNPANPVIPVNYASPC
jgi:hypothetical protein